MRRRMSLSGLLCALGIVSAIACHDPCLLVAGCRDSTRVAIEGRVVRSDSGQAVGGTVVTLLMHTSAGLDSARTTSDARGLFSISVPVGQLVPDTLALRVKPPGKPGYVISPVDCAAVTRWGDGCVLNPIVSEPTFPIFRFVYRNDITRPAANVRVSFKRTGGAMLRRRFRTLLQASHFPVESRAGDRRPEGRAAAAAGDIDSP
jgi:hypothetical protein